MHYAITLHIKYVLVLQTLHFNDSNEIFDKRLHICYHLGYILSCLPDTYNENNDNEVHLTILLYSRTNELNKSEILQ
jgi:hypothetical protein